ARLKLQSTFEACGGSRSVVANTPQALQLVLNLVLNAERALKDQPAGHIAISVDGGPANVTLIVADNGPGVPEDQQSRLFAPGALASPGFLGIGLAVSRHLAERFGGTLVHEPAGDAGGRFVLTVPHA